jgi:hypothetical protein
VRVDLADSVDLRTYLVPWQARIPGVWTDVYPPCATPSYVRVYLPGNITLLKYFLLLNYTEFQNAPTAYAFLYGSWRRVQSFLDPAKMLWLKIVANTGEQLTGRAVLVALCGSGTNPNPKEFFDQEYYESNKYIEFTKPVSLSDYPDGFSIVVWPKSYKSRANVMLFNTTSPQDIKSFIDCTKDVSEIVAILYVPNSFWWHFDSFCYDRHIWERLGSGSANTYFISVNRMLVLYQIATVDGKNLPGYWWLRSYPNSIPDQNKPMISFRRLNVTTTLNDILVPIGFSAALIPFTWPRPYYYLDFKDPNVAYRTT